MTESRRWRRARFDNDVARQEFVERARSLEHDDLEVESELDDPIVLFCAPAHLEVGLASMVSAHGGRILPTP